MKLIYRKAAVLAAVAIAALVLPAESALAQLYQLTRSESVLEWTYRSNPNPDMRKIDDTTWQYSFRDSSGQYSWILKWYPPDPQSVTDGGTVGIRLEPQLLERGSMMVGCTLGTNVQGITNGDRRVEGRAEAGISGSTGQPYTKPSMGTFTLTEHDEPAVVITLWGGCWNDQFVLARYTFQRSVAPPEPGALGQTWYENESGWDGVWMRRGDSNVFDATWTSGGSGQVTAVMTVDVTGSAVSIRRTESSDGNDCTYTGALGTDGVTAAGTYTCTRYPGPFPWVARIE